MKTAAACGNRSGAAPCPRVGRRFGAASPARRGLARRASSGRRGAALGTGRRGIAMDRDPGGTGQRHMDQELDTMKTLLMRAWRRFGAYGLALAAALATAWAVREHVGQGEPSRWRPTRPLSNDWSRPRTWRRARGWTNRTCSDGRFPRPGRPVPAWIRWRRKHCWARCCQRISMRARSSCRHICWANPPGRRRRRLRRSLHCQQECAP